MHQKGSIRYIFTCTLTGITGIAYHDSYDMVYHHHLPLRNMVCMAWQHATVRMLVDIWFNLAVNYSLSRLSHTQHIEPPSVIAHVMNGGKNTTLFSTAARWAKGDSGQIIDHHFWHVLVCLSVKRPSPCESNDVAINFPFSLVNNSTLS